MPIMSIIYWAIKRALIEKKNFAKLDFKIVVNVVVLVFDCSLSALQLMTVSVLMSASVVLTMTAFDSVVGSVFCVVGTALSVDVVVGTAAFVVFFGVS